MCALGSIVELGLKKMAKAIDDPVFLIANDNKKIFHHRKKQGVAGQ